MQWGFFEWLLQYNSEWSSRKHFIGLQNKLSEPYPQQFHSICPILLKSLWIWEWALWVCRMFISLMKETKRLNQAMVPCSALRGLPAPVRLMGYSLCIIIINGLGGPKVLKRVEKLARAQKKLHCFYAGVHKSLLNPEALLYYD